MLKKITWGLIGLTMGGVSVAGDMGSCHPNPVTISCPCSKWSLGVDGLYLKPLYSDYSSNSLLEPSANGDSDWGYRIKGSYSFNTGNDISLSWLHFDNDTTFSERFAPTPFTATLLLPYSLRLNTRLDQVNLLLGQSANTGLFKHSYFYAGLQYARFRKNERNLYLTFPTPLAAAAPGGISFQQNTDFNGVGPSVGIAYDYPLFQGLSVLADGSTALLFGTGRSESWYTFSPNGLIPNSNYGSKKQVVPEFEAKLGLNYGIPCEDGVFNIEGGYRALTYLNGLQHISSINRALINDVQFGLYGPYLGVKWVGRA